MTNRELNAVTVGEGTGSSYAVRDAAFEEWLHEEYPHHDPLDHDTLGAYDRWLREQRLAFNAGWRMRKAASYMVSAYGGNPLKLGAEPEDDWMKGDML